MLSLSEWTRRVSVERLRDSVDGASMRDRRERNLLSSNRRRLRSVHNVMDRCSWIDNTTYMLTVVGRSRRRPRRREGMVR